MTLNAKQSASSELASEFRDPNWGASQLMNIAIFKGFTKDELKKVYSQGEIITLKPKAYAVIEGEPTRGLYIILSGTMSVYKNDPMTGSMHRIAHLEAGNNFGELSLFDTANRSASVGGESTCHLFHLDATVFQGCLKKLGGDAVTRFYKSCAEELVSRFRKLNTDYITVQQLLWRHSLRTDDAAAETGDKPKDQPVVAKKTIVA